MDRIQVILTLDIDNIPTNFQEIVAHEKEIVSQWKAEGFLGAFIFKTTKKWCSINF